MSAPKNRADAVGPIGNVIGNVNGSWRFGAVPMRSAIQLRTGDRFRCKPLRA